jgi:hypothetical protein
MADASGRRPQADQDVPLLIQGLIAELPPRGKPFPRAMRERWLAALKVNLDLVYGDASEQEDEDRDH